MYKVFKLLSFIFLSVVWVHQDTMWFSSILHLLWAVTSTPQPGWPDLLSYSTSCRTCQKGFCIGVSWKDKACSLLSSVAFSKRQPASLSLSPPSAPPPPLVPVFLFQFSVPMNYQTNVKIHTINILFCVCIPSDTYAQKHRPPHPPTHTEAGT